MQGLSSAVFAALTDIKSQLHEVQQENLDLKRGQAASAHQMSSCMETIVQTRQLASENLRATVQGPSCSLPLPSAPFLDTGMSHAARIRARKHFATELMRRQQASAGAWHGQVTYLLLFALLGIAVMVVLQTLPALTTFKSSMCFLQGTESEVLEDPKNGSAPPSDPKHVTWNPTWQWQEWQGSFKNLSGMPYLPLCEL